MLEKTIILTPNKRLARHLQHEFSKHSSLQKEVVWITKRVLPLSSWLASCWKDNPDERILLNPYQERLIWQKLVIETLGESYYSIIDEAIDFHELINGWQIKEFTAFENKTEDIVIFESLYQNFKNYCKKNGLVTMTELPTLIIPYLPIYNLTDVTFAGFDEYNLQIQSLMAAIEGNGCKIIKVDPNICQKSSQKKLGLDNLNDEIALGAKWAKGLIEHSPQRTVGIVVPNLVELRSKVEEIFTEIFIDSSSFNISAGIPLKTVPIIKCAMELLSLNSSLELQTLTSILISPYISGIKNERSERFLLCSNLQKLDNVQIEPNDLESLAKKYKNKVPLFIDMLTRCALLYDSRSAQNLSERDNFKLYLENRTLNPSGWCDIFVKTLKVMGWPGENNLTKSETIAINQFTKLLKEIALSDPYLGKISYKRMLHNVRELVANAQLQPEVEIDSRIQIMGTLEANGINFDNLWIMGVDENNWPRPPKPNPFIPIAIQKELSLPHCSMERELQFCQTLIDRYKRSATEIIFSYVKEADDQTIPPSPLIADVSETSPAELNLTKPTFSSEKIYRSKLIEKVSDNYTSNINLSELEHTPSGLIEFQSLCPFRAFMRFRLKTEETKKPSFGISKIDRGLIIHGVLEKFWQKAKNHKNLCDMGQEKLELIALECISEELDKHNLTKPIHDLEKKCLVRHLNRLFALEKERYPFTVIATEKRVTIKLANLPISLRIDRIDQLQDGKTLLLDYKTGKKLPSAFDWFKPRPENIQLLLYSLAVDQAEGMALIQINSEGTKFKNFKMEDLAAILRKIDPVVYDKKEITWAELLKYWQKILNSIAEEFGQGCAKVSPSSLQICKQCSFALVCRIVR
jgi:ATP-dependent helicase/nuclease subunit B